jgi:succinoglycan biosynthesis transport protein ExoP
MEERVVMETNSEPRPGASFSVARALWRRRKGLAIVAFAASCAAAFGVIAFLPNVYSSTAIVIVERQQVPEGFVRPSVTGDLETRLYTVSQEILSRGRLRALIERFSLYPELRQRTTPESVVEQMRRDIRLKLKGAESPAGHGATIAFDISYQGPDPATVAEVTNTLASFYVEENTRVRERQAAGTAEFLRGQVAEMQQRLEDQERRLRDVKGRYMGELPEQLEMNRATLDRYASQLRLNNEAQFRTRERREAIVRRVIDGGAAAADDPAARLVKLQQELAELQTRYTDKYPDVARAKAEIAALERQLAQMPPRSKSEPADQVGRRQSTLSEIEAELRGLKDEEQRLQQTIAIYQRRVENAPRSEQELKTISRNYETTKELYLSMLKRQEDAQLAETMEQRQKGELFRILDPALPPQSPVAPNRLVLALMGLMAAIGVGAGAAILAERFDTSFHTTEDLRAFTRVPVLASIPRIVTVGDAARRRRRLSGQALATAAALVLIAGAAYYVANGNERLAVMLTRGG